MFDDAQSDTAVLALSRLMETEIEAADARSRERLMQPDEHGIILVHTPRFNIKHLLAHRHHRRVIRESFFADIDSPPDLPESELLTIARDRYQQLDLRLFALCLTTKGEPSIAAAAALVAIVAGPSEPTLLRRTAAWLLASCSTDTTTIVESLMHALTNRSEQSEVRCEVLKTVSCISKPHIAFPLLAEILADKTEDEDVRCAAARSLIDVSPNHISALHQLLSIAKDKQEAPKLRCEAILSVDTGPSAASHTVPELARILSDTTDDHLVRSRVPIVLIWFKDRAAPAVPTLVAVLEELHEAARIMGDSPDSDQSQLSIDFCDNISLVLKGLGHAAKDAGPAMIRLVRNKSACTIARSVIAQALPSVAGQNPQAAAAILHLLQHPRGNDNSESDRKCLQRALSGVLPKTSDITRDAFLEQYLLNVRDTGAAASLDWIVDAWHSQWLTTRMRRIVRDRARQLTARSSHQDLMDSLLGEFALRVARNPFWGLGLDEYANLPDRICKRLATATTNFLRKCDIDVSHRTNFGATIWEQATSPDKLVFTTLLDGDSPINRAIQREFHDGLSDAIALAASRLDEVQRLVYEARFVVEQNRKAVAIQLGLSLYTVRRTEAEVIALLSSHLGRFRPNGEDGQDRQNGSPFRKLVR